MKTCVLTALAVGILSTAPVVWGQSCASSQYHMLQICDGTLGCVPYCDQTNSPPSEVLNDYWGAIVRDEGTGKIGAGDHQKSESEAVKVAESNCVQRGGSNCKTILTYRNQCAVIASGVDGSGLARDDTFEGAKSGAIAACNEVSTTPCKILYSDCSLPARVWGQCPPSQYHMLQMCDGALDCLIYCDQLSSPAPSSEIWNNYWGAIVQDPKTNQLGTSNHQDSKFQAIESANADCVQRGGSNCEPVLTYRNACAAVAAGTRAGGGFAAKSTLEEAKSRAIALCNEYSSTPCTILYTDCSLPVRVR